MHLAFTNTERWTRTWKLAVCVGLVVAGGLARAADSLPGPERAYSDKASVVFSLDAKAMAASPAGKILMPLFSELPGELGNLPGAGQVRMPTGVDFESLKSMMEGVELGRMVLVVEGNPEGDAFTSEDSLMMVAELTEVLKDQEAFIGGMLAVMEQEKPGYSNQVAQTRTRVGVAEVFELPEELTKAQGLPWVMNFAVGPGSKGSVLALGKAERLKAFLAGQGGGAVPAGVDRLMPDRGQLWLYSVVPPEATKAMGGADSPEMAMVGDLSKTLEQVREVGLNVKMGSGGVQFDLAVGCASAEAASQMAQDAQGFLGIAKMMASQQDPAAAGVINRLKVGSERGVFNLGTSVTLAELRQGVQAARKEMGMTGAAAEVEWNMPEVKPLEVVPVPEVEFLELKPAGQGHVRYGKIRVNNVVEKAISTMRITYVYLDEQGSKLGEWTRVQLDTTPVLVPAGQVRELQVPMFNVPLRAASVQAILRRVEFSDGTAWP